MSRLTQAITIFYQYPQDQGNIGGSEDRGTSKPGSHGRERWHQDHKHTIDYSSDDNEQLKSHRRITKLGVNLLHLQKRNIKWFSFITIEGLSEDLLP